MVGEQMKVKSCGSLLRWGLAAAMILAAGCTTTHGKSTPKPSHSAAAADDFPTAIQAGIPASNFKK
jgi:hypothetical protein